MSSDTSRGALRWELLTLTWEPESRGQNVFARVVAGVQVLRVARVDAGDEDRYDGYDGDDYLPMLDPSRGHSVRACPRDVCVRAVFARCATGLTEK